MPFDEEGREFKVCAFDECGITFYRDEDPHNKLNEHNWGLKEYCCKKHKRLAKLPFRKKKEEKAG